MDADGSNQRMLNLDLDRSISDVQWASNGRGLYFQYADEGVSKIGYSDLNGNMEVVAERIGGNSIGRPYGAAVLLHYRMEM